MRAAADLLGSKKIESALVVARAKRDTPEQPLSPWEAVEPKYKGSLWLRWAIGAVAWLAFVACDANEVRIGDGASVVTEVLGEATAEYRSKSEIEASRFAHFEFDSLTDTSAPKTKASGLPEVGGRALWFPFLTTAGKLVYLDADDRVTAVFFAGT